MEKQSKLYPMTAAALLTALTCVLAPLSVPVGPVSITLQNFVIGLAVVILGTRLSLLSCAIYLALGMVGLPVFSGYSAGLGRLVGPTGGYLIGFLFFAAVGGFLSSLAFRQWGSNDPKTYAAVVLSLLAGAAVLYIFGTVWYVHAQQVSFEVALGFCVYPFIIPDIIKMILATVIGITVRQALRRAGIFEGLAAEKSKISY